MEFEIDDDPQGETEENLGKRDGGIVEDHSALKNQSSAKAQDYLLKDRRDESLVSRKD